MTWKPGFISGQNAITLTLLILIICGFALRIYGLGDQSLWIDECYSITAAMGMMETLVPHMPSGVPYRGAILNTSLIALSMSVFGVSEPAARLPSVIFGVLSILAAYLLSRRLFGEKVGLATAFIMTFAVVEIAWSRQARMYQQLQFFYILSLYLFRRFTDEWDLKIGVLTAVTTVCTLLTHPPGFSLLLVYPLYIFIVRLVKSARRVAMPSLRLSLRSARHGARPDRLGYHHLFNGNKTVENFIPSTFKPRTKKDIVAQIFSRTNLLLIAIMLIGILLGQYYGVFNSVIGGKMDYSRSYAWYLRTFFPVIFAASVLGVLAAFSRNWRSALLPALAIAIPLYTVSFHGTLLGFRYIYLALPLMFMFFAKAVEYASEMATKNSLLQSASLILLLALVASMPVFSFVPGSTYYLEPMAPQPDFASVYGYLLENRQPGDTLISSYPEMALWFGQTPDYWLAFAISGFSSSRWMDKDHKAYSRTMTPAIRNAEELKGVIESNERGWIVIDSMAGSRIPRSYWGTIKEKTEWVSIASRPGEAGAVNLYMWGE